MRIIKITVIVILSLMIAACGGLLVYGATLSPVVSLENNFIVSYVAPPGDISEGAYQWYSLDDFYIKSDLSLRDKAVCMLVYGAFNQTYCKQYAMNTCFDTFVAQQNFYSVISRSKANGDTFYLSTSHTGTSNYAHLILHYGEVTESASTFNVQYDFDTKNFGVSWPRHFDCGKRNDSKYASFYSTYALLELPIDFGDVYDKTCTVTLVDASSVTITPPSASLPYYRISFCADIEAINQSKESRRRLNDSMGGKLEESSIVFKSVTVEAELWQSGVFRSLNSNVVINAKYKGKKGEVEQVKETVFTYDYTACSVANRIRSVGVNKYLSDKSSERYSDEIAAFDAVYGTDN